MVPSDRHRNQTGMRFTERAKGLVVMSRPEWMAMAMTGKLFPWHGRVLMEAALRK